MYFVYHGAKGDCTIFISSSYGAFSYPFYQVIESGGLQGLASCNIENRISQSTYISQVGYSTKVIVYLKVCIHIYYDFSLTFMCICPLYVPYYLLKTSLCISCFVKDTNSPILNLQQTNTKSTLESCCPVSKKYKKTTSTTYNTKHQKAK